MAAPISRGSTALVAIALPLACWRVASTLSISDSVTELELVNANALGGHLTVALALDVRPGARLARVLDALRPHAFPVLLLATVAALWLAVLVGDALARHALALLGPRAADHAAAGELADVTCAVGRIERLVAERQMELAALQSKAQHLDDEICRAALDVDKRQRQLRAAEAQHAQLAHDVCASRIRALAAASPTASSAGASSSPSVGCTPYTIGTPPSERASAPGLAEPRAGGDCDDAGARVRGGGGGGGGDATRAERAARSPLAACTELPPKEVELSSPALEQFARLLGLGCGAAARGAHDRALG
ncbi:hypothetical protein KFE25_008040 [Diacronema lutheri]|uniref:Uncharacterized protein n=1 Tax=Diacronema lutheri TaxID=2081491 RepID=A0A8J5XDE9_DIALT|nr:hypothetical protein KFE25_008040 [Diacronema lutheri]